MILNLSTLCRLLRWGSNLIVRPLCGYYIVLNRDVKPNGITERVRKMRRPLGFNSAENLREGNLECHPESRNSKQNIDCLTGLINSSVTIS